MWVAGIIAGAIMLVLGLLRLGAVINFIPAPVITGFTSGIALIIFIGQIDNFLGIRTPAEETAAMKAYGYFAHPLPSPNLEAIACGAIVVATMVLLPRFLFARRVPAALVGIVIASLAAWGLGWGVAIIGDIPATILLDDRFRPETLDLGIVPDLLVPATAIAALGAIESLLAGTVAGRMTGIRLNANQELVAQGVGNIAIPFFGGVPATAAIARMSVGLKAGGVTRMVSFVHSAALLVSALFFGSIIGRIPLAALAGVLMVTAFRMNEWHLIRFYMRKRLKGPTFVMFATMLATVALDLTQAILVGVVLSLLLFISQISRLEIVPTSVDPARLPPSVKLPSGSHLLENISVVYVSGPVFFGAASQLVEGIESLGHCRALILSLRGVPLIDASGLHAIEHIWEHQTKRGDLLYLTGLQTQVRGLFERAGLIEDMGQDKFLWSADQAISAAIKELGGSPEPAEETAPEPELEVPERDEELDEMPLGVVKVDWV
jgi:SulP family sulfate permease